MIAFCIRTWHFIAGTVHYLIKEYSVFGNIVNMNICLSPQIIHCLGLDYDPVTTSWVIIIVSCPFCDQNINNSLAQAHQPVTGVIWPITNILHIPNQVTSIKTLDLPLLSVIALAMGMNNATLSSDCKQIHNFSPSWQKYGILWTLCVLKITTL